MTDNIKSRIHLKLLIIRFSSMGDIVLTTPVIRALKNQLNAEIHFLVKKSFVPVIQYNTNIDHIWCEDPENHDLVKKVKAQNFDYIIDLQKTLKSYLWCLKINAKRLTFDKATFSKLLKIKLGINNFETLHMVDRYMSAVTPLGVRYDHKGLDFYFDPKMETDINLPTHYIVASIGGTHFTKRFPISKWKELINLLGQKIVLIGGKQDELAAKEIEENHPGQIINLCGKSSIQHSAWIIKNANKVITNDTGMMHIAAALNKTIVSIWGGTIYQFGFWPLYAEGVNHNTPIEIQELSCRPCSKFGRADCPKGHFKCMQEINTIHMAEIINK